MSWRPYPPPSAAFRSPATWRRACYERDKGKCSRCGIATLAGVMLGRHPWSGTGHLWQADHIRPLALFFEQASVDPVFWGLENLQSLCMACHSVKTMEDHELRRRMGIPRGMYMIRLVEAAGNVSPARREKIDKLKASAMKRREEILSRDKTVIRFPLHKPIRLGNLPA